MNFKTLRRISYILILITSLLVSGCSNAAKADTDPLSEDEKLIVYTSHKPEIYEPIIKEFEERSGIWVQVVQGGTNELLQQISDEGSEGKADIMFGGGVDSLVAYEEYFEPYVTSQSDELFSGYSSESDSYTVFSQLPIVFIYNEKLVLSAGTPRSWGELLSVRWKGRVAFADPNTSGSSYTELATLVQVMGTSNEEETVADFVDILNGDICDDSGDVIDQVISGEKAVGVTLEETALKRIKKGAEIGIIYPKDGTSTVCDGCAILKDAPHIENAKLFMEFIVSDDVQHLLEDRLSRRSVRKDITQALPVSEMDYDLDYAISHRKDILDSWNEEVEGN